MRLPKISSLPILSIAGVALLAGGLGLALFASQQQQDQRSQAYLESGGGTGGTAPYNCNDTSTMDRTCRYSTGCASGESYVSGGSCDNPYMVCCEKRFATSPACPSGQVCNTGSPGSGYTDTGTSCGNVGGGATCWKKPSAPSTGGDSQYIGRSCSTPQGSGTCQYRNSYNCTGAWVTNYCPGSDNVVCCVNAKPGKPSNVTATCSEQGTLTVNWTKASGYDNYAVFIYDKTAYGPTLYSPDHNVSSPIVTGSSYSFTGLIAGHEYNYWMNTANGSLYSDPEPSAYTQSVTCALPQTPTPTATPTPGVVKLEFDLLLHGIGYGGDSQENEEEENIQERSGNKNPVHRQRPITVELVGEGKTYTLHGDVRYDKNGQTGSFVADGDDFTFEPTTAGFEDFENGEYTVWVKFEQSKKTLASRASFTINWGDVIKVPQFELKTGDVNNDDALNALDYEMLMVCYSDFGEEKPECDTAEKKERADLNDDGDVNYEDLSLLLREMSTQR